MVVMMNTSDYRWLMKISNNNYDAIYGGISNKNNECDGVNDVYI